MPSQPRRACRGNTFRARSAARRYAPRSCAGGERGQCGAEPTWHAHAGVVGATAPARCRAVGVRPQRQAAEVLASGTFTSAESATKVARAVHHARRRTRHAGVRARGSRADCLPPHRVCLCVAAGANCWCLPVDGLQSQRGLRMRRATRWTGQAPCVPFAASCREPTRSTLSTRHKVC